MFFNISQENAKFVITIFGIKMTFKKWWVNQLVDSCCIANLEYFKKQKTKFPHLIGIAIAKSVKIGKNCVIFQNVTIGVKNEKAPEIGDNVIIYPNSVIFGGVRIGNNSKIGAGSVVLHDVPENCVVEGNPAKVIRNINE